VPEWSAALGGTWPPRFAAPGQACLAARARARRAVAARRLSRGLHRARRRQRQKGAHATARRPTRQQPHRLPRRLSPPAPQRRADLVRRRKTAAARSTAARLAADLKSDTWGYTTCDTALSP